MRELEVKPKLDLTFKKIFTEDKNHLKRFLSEALDIPYDSVLDLTIKNPLVLPEQISDKYCVLDVRVNVDGREIDVEIQLGDSGSFRERVLYYWSAMFHTALKSGTDYSKLPETIVVSIINFNLLPCREYHSEYLLKERKRNDILTEKEVIHFLELKKLPQEPHEATPLELWLKFINAETYEEIEIVDKMPIDRELKSAIKLVKKFNTDDAMKQQVASRERALIEKLSAEAALTNKGRQEGRREGRREGRQEERAQLVSKLKAKGMSEEEIRELIE